MEETQKVVELKKAYAEILVNTAKEAACRVMEWEQKSLGFQQDLKSTKESALLMLLRFKHMIDAKTNEANITSLTQQKRMEELESQLNETEGTVVGLREELKQANAQLDKVKSNNHTHSNIPIQEEDVLSCENTVHFPSQLSNCCNSATQTLPTTSDSPLDNFCFGNPNLASVNIKRKEPDLCRNGCTQRIRAIEMNLANKNLLSEDVSDQQFLKNGESIIKEDELNEHTNVKKNSVKVCKKPRRKKRYGKAKASSCRFSYNQQMKPRKPSLAFSNSKNISYTYDTLPLVKAEKTNLAESSSGLEEKMPNKNDHHAICSLRRSVRKRKVAYRGDDFATLRGSIRKSGEDWVKTGIEADIKGEINSRLVTSNTELIDVPILVKPYYNAAESTVFSNLDANHEVDKESLTVFGAKTSEFTNGAQCEGENKRLVNVKYTFSRKRKKESVSNPDESSSLGEGVVKNSSFANEPPRESRRLVQVAHQLISLSGKRCL